MQVTQSGPSRSNPSAEDLMRIYRILRGWVQPCGCLVGVYETFAGGVVGIIDHRGSGCPDVSHKIGRPVEPPVDVWVSDHQPVAACDAAHVG